MNEEQKEIVRKELEYLNNRKISLEERIEETNQSVINYRKQLEKTIQRIELLSEGL